MARRKISSILLSDVLLLLIGINSLATAYTNPLDGTRAVCRFEGESVPVDHIDKHKCYSCICKNGLVDCKSEFYCPPRDGCHMLVEKTENGCCQKCKGCIYNNAHYLSHTEWTDPIDSCKVLRCEAGVVTVSNLQCYTPCANPLPPEPGTCCATCPECKINGQIATDDRDVISDDPCLKCRCSRNRMICSKKACPVLQCAQKLHPPGECCPRCNGTRTLYPVPKTCTLQNAFVREGHNFNIDRCTNCTCKNETSICQRAACPVLDCAPDLQKSMPGNCCKKCVMSEELKTQCSYDGKSYEDGQSWKLDACRSCKCHRGMPSCAMTRCNVTLPCAPGSKLVQLPDECCKKCVEVEGVCMVFGDPHYKTFDGRIYTFHGIGKYQLTADCQNHTFSVRVANTYSTKFVKTSASTKRVAIRYGDDIRINLQQKRRVKLNNKRIKLPYKNKDKVRIEKVGANVEVYLGNGVKIFWTGKSFLEVSVPARFKNKLCGLCGNFNSNVQDDLRMRRGGTIVRDNNDIIMFGSSWCVGMKAVCAKQAKQAMKMPSCTSVYRSAAATAASERNYCKYLTNNELFSECESKLNHLKYYKACKMDMCNCPGGKCYCESLLAYARECERLDVNLPNWQKHSLCDVENLRRPKLSSSPSSSSPFITTEDIDRLRRQRTFNRTLTSRIPLLIN